MRKTIVVILFIAVLLPFNATIIKSKNMSITSEYVGDFDPLVDIQVTVNIQAIRYLEDDQTNNAKSAHSMFKDLFFKAKNTDNKQHGFYVKIFINDEEYTSEIFSDSLYMYNLNWTATLNVPDDKETVNIKIQLWDTGDGKTGDVLCDISGDSGDSEDSYDAEMEYNIKTGHWSGDDNLDNDLSGYGRLCGTDDGTIYKKDRDSELWFNIYQNDYDGDGIPYWAEVNEYGTDPKQKNTGDPDEDKIPVQWEYKWGYDPFSWENHEKLDPDGDSINNYEEYLTQQWFSDPNRKDVFVELDIMDEGPNGEKTYFPEIAEELIQTAFDRQNIVFHLDYGDMGGTDIIPFDSLSTGSEIRAIYQKYFLNGAEWRRGVFHYGVVVYQVDGPNGYTFNPNAFQISSNGLEKKSKNPALHRNIVYASCYMHELGHTFNFHPIPGHNDNSKYPWQIGWWINQPYKSCMNYAWVFRIVDYSDGSRPPPDIDDWSRIDYSFFEREWR